MWPCWSRITASGRRTPGSCDCTYRKTNSRRGCTLRLCLFSALSYLEGERHQALFCEKQRDCDEAARYYESHRSKPPGSAQTRTPAVRSIPPRGAPYSATDGPCRAPGHGGRRTVGPGGVNGKQNASRICGGRFTQTERRYGICFRVFHRRASILCGASASTMNGRGSSGNARGGGGHSGRRCNPRCGRYAGCGCGIGVGCSVGIGCGIGIRGGVGVGRGRRM